MGAKEGAAPAWKALLACVAASQAPLTLEQRLAVSEPLIKSVDTLLDQLAPSQPPSSQKLFKALDIGALNSAITGLDPKSPGSFRQLLAVNDVLAGSNPHLAAVLLEHSFLITCVRLHQRVGDVAHPLSQAVVLLLCTTVLLAGAAAGDSLEAVASRPELLELLVGELVYLAVKPAVLLTPGGLGAAARCVQMCWEITRTPTPHCKGFRELLERIDMAGRLMLIATVAATGSTASVAGGTDGGDAATTSSGADAAAAVTSGIASLEMDAAARSGAITATPASAGAASTSGSSAAAGVSGGDMFEERLALAGQASSLVGNLAGLGTRGLELSARGLAPNREWLLRPGRMVHLRGMLEGLADGLGELRRRMERAAQAEGGGEVGAGRLEDDNDLAPNRVPHKRLLDQVEGAIRNLLVLLGLPTIVMGNNEEDVVEACGFVIRHAFSMFTEGYVDTMRVLRDAVADPPGPASPRGPFARRYPGDYAPFFRAYAGHIQTIAPALGVQLEDWGVRFTGEQMAKDLPGMQVGEGVDERIAQAWLKGQVQDIINWGHTMMTLVRLADQAKLPPPKPKLPQPPPHQQQQQQEEQAFPPVAAARPYGSSGPASSSPPTAPAATTAAGAAVAAAAPATPAAAAAGSSCASCGAAPPAGGPPFQSCSKCKGVRYCSRACQLGHWPQHKTGCKAATPAPAAAVGAAS